MHMIKALSEYNRDIEKISNAMKEEITDILIYFDIPEDYELLLMILSDYYRTLGDIAFSIRRSSGNWPENITLNWLGLREITERKNIIY